MNIRHASLIFLCITFILPPFIFSQINRIGLGGYIGNGLSINANYSYLINNSFFVQPNLSASITKDDKETFSFMTYEINIGYYLLNGKNNKLYLILGSSYNSFISQSREGNASFISDVQPPYYFTGKTRENCFGLIGKLGFFINISTLFNIGMEAKYLALFPKVKYNYLPKEYSITKGTETYNMVLIGIIFGFSF
ncbi:MAG: hypothetical protein ACOYU5_08820 [Stygiobacter sp.]